jgi:hypothetical protein
MRNSLHQVERQPCWEESFVYRLPVRRQLELIAANGGLKLTGAPLNRLGAAVSVQGLLLEIAGLSCNWTIVSNDE